MNRAVLFFMVAGGLIVSAAPPGESREADPACNGFSPAANASPIAAPSPDAPAPVDLPGLSNLVTFHDGFISGSAPEGDEGFETLQKLGIRTIISVDGAIPDVDRARAHSLRYVHLPIGYNGMDESRTLELARAVRDLPGPIYIHCHHGKHRSAAAAAAVAVTLGRLNNDSAIARMKVSGTATDYTGLYRCVEVAVPAAPDRLNTAPSDFPEVCKPSSLVDAMVEIDEALDHLKEIQGAGWTTPADHPDLVPAAEAGRLADLQRLLLADAEVQSLPQDFAEWLALGAKHSQSLEDAIIASASAAELSERLKKVSTSCTDCHARFRDPTTPHRSTAPR